MASSKKGGDGFTGKTGRTVVYLLNGKLVKREIGYSTKPPTELQKAGFQITSITSKFLSPFKEVIDLGYKLEAKNTGKTPYNHATSNIRLNAITGSYPEQRIDYPNVLLTKGNKPLTEGLSINAVEDGLLFSWDPAVSDSGRRWNDQAIMVAYIPSMRELFYLLNGARRTEGSDILSIPRFKDTVVIETYISFIAASHKSVSNSVYTGQVIWEGL